MTRWRVTFSLLSLIASAALHFVPVAARTTLPPVHEVSAIIQQRPAHEFIDAVAPELGRIDVMGNVIQDAVGDYRVDQTGETYETHAPEVVLTHLAPPGA
jgi:hypothetical protein